jgi:hypothetical protein
MPKRPTALTAAAGEHFVAYCLSRMGLLVALTRGGSPAVDLMVSSPDGRETIAIQVKTAHWARREYKTEKSRVNDRREWDVGQRAQRLRGERLFYALVDLRGGGFAIPEVFIVPSDVVAIAMEVQRSRYMFWLLDRDVERYQDRWDLIRARLQMPPGTVIAESTTSALTGLTNRRR